MSHEMWESHLVTGRIESVDRDRIIVTGFFPGSVQLDLRPDQPVVVVPAEIYADLVASVDWGDDRWT